MLADPHVRMARKAVVCARRIRSLVSITFSTSFFAALLLHHSSACAQNAGISLPAVAAGQSNAQTALDKLQSNLKAARDKGDSVAIARTLYAIGRVYLDCDQIDDAQQYFIAALPYIRQAKDRGGLADSLSNLGWIYYRKHAIAQALDAYNEALPIYREVADREGEAETLKGLGHVYRQMGKAQEALDSYQQCRSLLHQLGKTASEADAAESIGDVYSSSGDLPKSIDWYSKALALYRQAGYVASQARTTSNIGSAYLETGDPSKAIAFFSDALPLYRSAGDHAGEGDTLINLGLAYRQTAQLKQSIDSSNQALRIYSQLGDLAGEAKALGQIGACSMDLNQYEEALEHYQRAATLFKAVDDRRNQAIALDNIGSAYVNLDEPQKALDTYAKALPILREISDSSNEAIASYGIGRAYSLLGKPGDAEASYNHALAIYRRAGDQDGQARTLAAIGEVEDTLGRPRNALDAMNQAVALYEKTGRTLSEEAVTLANTGAIYYSLGNMQKALDQLQRAMVLVDVLKDPALEATTLSSIGAIYSTNNQHQKAIDFYDKALALRRKASDPLGEADTLTNLGVTYTDLNKPQKALDCFQQALPIQRKLGDRVGEAYTLNAVARAYSTQGDQQKAFDFYSQALAPGATVGDPLLNAGILFNLMVVRRGARPSLAIFFGKQSVNAVQNVRGNAQSLDKELRSSFLTSKQHYYRTLADTLIDQGRLSEAERVLELLKAREYEDFVRGETPSRHDQVALTATEQEAKALLDAAIQQAGALYQQWFAISNKAARTPEDDKDLKQLRDKMDTGGGSLESCLSQLEELFDKKPVKAQDNAPGSAGALEELVTSRPDAVGLYTLVGDDRYRVIVVSGTSPAATREFAITESDLNHKIEEFRRALNDPDIDPLPAAQQLYKIIVAPVAELLAAAHPKTLFWSLDGALRYIPMAALHDGAHYLVEQYANVIASGTTAPGGSPKPASDSLRAVGLGISRQYEPQLRGLPKVTDELFTVIRDARFRASKGVLPGSIMMNDEFTLDAMENALRQPPPVVHIASHFVFNAGDARGSYLLLAGQQEGGSGYELTLAELNQNDKLRFQGTELLTLSACETGVGGGGHDGREVDGLGTMTQLKGARSVLASLWEVDDESTAGLMREFYSRWVQGAGKLDKAEALRDAQLHLLNPSGGQASGDSGRAASLFTHPHYWAPFILIGNSP